MSEIRQYLSQFDAAAPLAMAEMLRNPSPEQEQGLRIYLGNERYRRMRGLALRLSYTHVAYAARDNTGKSELAAAELPTRRADGGGRYTLWLGLVGAGLEARF